MAVEIAGVRFKNPVLTASGTFGYGLEFAPYLDLARLGAVVVKGLSLEPRPGNPTPRIYETPAGMLNAIGLQNVGIDAFLRDKLPPLRATGATIIANVLGGSVEEYVEAARRLAGADGLAALELNVSCPNVKEGGIHFATDPAQTGRVTGAVRRAIGDFPLIIKLSPNVTDIVAFARACRDAGADAVSAVNTFVGIAIDAETLRPRIANVTGGLSGPAIKPLALLAVRRVFGAVAQATGVPLIGMGGIQTAEDAVEFFLAGASAVAVGTALFIDPAAPVKIAAGLAEYVAARGLPSVAALTGRMLDSAAP